MNLTHFIGLENTGRHLIAIQTQGEKNLDQIDTLLNQLKKKDLVHPSAYILKAEPYIYEQASSVAAHLNRLSTAQKKYFEMINAASFGIMSHHIEKWKTVLKPYRELFPQEGFE